jgi:hypothetical protein
METVTLTEILTEFSSTAYRLGLIFVKVGLVSLLNHFDFEGRGSEEMKFNKSSFALIPDQGEGRMKITKAFK